MKKWRELVVIDAAQWDTVPKPAKAKPGIAMDARDDHSAYSTACPAFRELRVHRKSTAQESASRNRERGQQKEESA